MCGRYTLRTKLNILLYQFAAEVTEAPDYDERYNVAPTQSVLAVRLADNKRQTCKLRWGPHPVLG